MWPPIIFIFATLVASQVAVSTNLGQRNLSGNHEELIEERDYTQNVVYYLDWFLGKVLRSYIDENYFYFQQFEFEISKFANYLEILSKFIGLAQVDGPKIQKKLNLARLRFDHMVVATQLMKRFSESGEPGAILVTQVIDLSVRTLIMYDNEGNPNIEVDAYETRVSDIFCELYSLEDDYIYEDKMELFTRNIFLEYSQKVKKSLEVLQQLSPLTRKQRSCWLRWGEK